MEKGETWSKWFKDHVVLTILFVIVVVFLIVPFLWGFGRSIGSYLSYETRIWIVVIIVAGYIVYKFFSELNKKK